MALKFKTKDEIPSELLPLYAERDGAWLLDVDEGDVLQLADAFAGQSHQGADFFQGLLHSAFEAEAQADDGGFAGREFRENFVEQFKGAFLVQVEAGQFGVFVRHHIREATGIVVAERSIERRRANRRNAEFADAVGLEAKLGGEFGLGGVAAELFAQTHLVAAKVIDLIRRIDGHADGLALAGERAADALANPQHGVGGELGALFSLLPSSIAIVDNLTNYCLVVNSLY